MTIEESVDNYLHEKNPQAEAVKHLLNVEPREAGSTETDVELKTDLSPSAIPLHTATQLLSNFLEMKPDQFCKKSVIADLVTIKERKLISQNRDSRKEIVELTRNRDVSFEKEKQKAEGLFKRMFTPRRKGDKQ